MLRNRTALIKPFNAARLEPYLLAAVASGFAALLFELLLFRRLELLLGRSVNATAIILAAYMAGLGLGAFIAARPYWQRLQPLQAATGFVLLELLAGGAAFGLLQGLPQLQSVGWLAQSGFPVLFLLLVPTLAMGMTMPFLCGAVLRREQDFRRGFHYLYAANTVGAMLGVSVGYVLLRESGFSPAGKTALAANVLAGLLVWSRRPRYLATGTGQRYQDVDQAPALFRTASLSRPAVLLTVAVCGYCILALEVVWMRALMMHFRATPALFSIVVSLVIGGLSLGALLAKTRDVAGWLQLAAWSVLGGCSALLFGLQHAPLWLAAVVLVVPCCVASGALFSHCVVELRRYNGDSIQATARLYLLNTAMAALGALSAAWLLLPWLGLAWAWLLCGAGFALLALGLAPTAAYRAASTICLLMIGLVASLQPSQRWADQVLQQFPGYQRAVPAVTATDATLQLARRDVRGQAVAWRLLTDGYSMSGSEYDSLRYMRLFAQLPQAVHGSPEKAMLISYGLGNTASALLADQRLQKLTIVDTSQASVELSRQMYVQTDQLDPLNDPRVAFQVDDGRHQLLLSDDNWDVITAEPPPPRLAGVVNLYTRDYFQLIYQRLNPGGLTTHWLPVDQLSWPSTQAIVRGFCAAFADCSLWLGSHYNWVLMGGREAELMYQQSAAPRLYEQPQARQLLRESGFERASLLASSFLADANQLKAWVGPGAHLDDDHPGRLQARPVSDAELKRYFAFMDDRAAQRRFENSAWAQQLWSENTAEQAKADWLWQAVLSGQSRLQGQAYARASLASLQAGLRMPALRLAGLSLNELGALTRDAAKTPRWLAGLLALMNGQRAQAVQWLERSDDARGQALLQCLQTPACGGA